jgi:hypothetical protein
MVKWLTQNESYQRPQQATYGELLNSLPAIVDIARQTSIAMSSIMKCNEPSANTTFTPPGCMLRAARHP